MHQRRLVADQRLRRRQLDGVGRPRRFSMPIRCRQGRRAGNLGTEVSREEPHTPKPLAKTLYIEYLRLWL